MAYEWSPLRPFEAAAGATLAVAHAAEETTGPLPSLLLHRAAPLPQLLLPPVGGGGGGGGGLDLTFRPESMGIVIFRLPR